MKRHKYSETLIQKNGNQTHFISRVPTSFTAFVGLTKKGPINNATQIKSFSQFKEMFGESEHILTYTVNHFFINGGKDAVIVSVGHDKTSDGTKIIGNMKTKSGIYSLDKISDINILCIPPYNNKETTSTTVYKSASRYCKKRHAFIIIDPPKNWQDTSDVKNNLKKLLENENAAIYFPRVKTKEKTNCVPCGIIAGVIARTDYSRGVWSSPAGTEATISGIKDLVVNITDNEIKDLNSVRVNCIRKIQGKGFLLWGAYAAKNSEWGYIPVRRTALFIEESIYRGIQWTVFETNDEPLWTSIRNSVITFMNGLFKHGAFAGRTPREAYFVKCDKSIITQKDMNRGIIHLEVGFAPLRPAEFIVIKIRLSAKHLKR